MFPSFCKAIGANRFKWCVEKCHFPCVTPHLILNENKDATPGERDKRGRKWRKNWDFSPMRGGGGGQDRLGGRKGRHWQATESENWNRVYMVRGDASANAQVLFMEVDSKSDQ